MHYWHLPDGTSALSYVRAPGVAGIPDPGGAGAVRFQAAFNGAARAVLRYAGSIGRVPQARSVMACDNEDCVEVGGGDSGGNGGGGGGGGGGVGGGGGGG